MIDQRALLTIAQGAAAAAGAYIFECLNVDPDPAKAVPDEQNMAVLIALALTGVLLETTMAQNMKNPEARQAIRAVVGQLSQEIISRISVDKPPESGILQ
jgi:hypothetical protein